MYVLPYGIICPHKILHTQNPREQYFLHSKIFNVKWILPFAFVKLIEKIFPPKQTHESATLYSGAWW